MTVSLNSFLLAILPSRNGVPCKKKLIWLTVQPPKSFFLWNPSYWSLQQRALYVLPVLSQITKKMCTQELLFKKINIFCCPIKDILKLAFCCYVVCFFTFVCTLTPGNEENNAYFYSLVPLLCFHAKVPIPWLTHYCFCTTSTNYLSFSQTQWKGK